MVRSHPPSAEYSQRRRLIILGGQQAARTTAGELTAHGYAEPATTRGESAYLIEAADHYLAHVEEGLGTKNLVADAMQAATGISQSAIAPLSGFV